MRALILVALVACSSENSEQCDQAWATSGVDSTTIDMGCDQRCVKPIAQTEGTCRAPNPGSSQQLESACDYFTVDGVAGCCRGAPATGILFEECRAGTME